MKKSSWAEAENPCPEIKSAFNSRKPIVLFNISCRTLFRQYSYISYHRLNPAYSEQKSCAYSRSFLMIQIQTIEKVSLDSPSFPGIFRTFQNINRGQNKTRLENPNFWA